MKRNLQAELMDDPTLDPKEHALALRGLARINAVSNSAGIFWPALVSLTPPVRILDVACGGGDVTLALARKAQRTGHAVSIEGCDISPTAVELANKRAKQAGLSVRFFTHNALAEPLPTGYDVIICSLFLHHLSEADGETLLRACGTAAGRRVLINDLARSRLGYGVAWVVTRILSRSRIVHVDGPRSVEGAFTPEEAQLLAERAGLPGATVARRWPFRFLLVWDRPKD